MRVTVLGVNGMTGRAVAAEFAGAGWQVLGTGRDPARFPAELRASGVGFVRSDRNDPAELGTVLGRGADVVVDCLCYTADQAGQLLRCADDFDSAVVLSSKAVYRDDLGRHSNSVEPPRFDGPVTEQQPVLEPDYSGEYASRTGYGPNKVAAERTLLDSGRPISILRPSRIHSPGAARPREWYVLKRLLDGRTRIPLAHGGRTGNHPTASVNLARLARVCAEQPGQRILNAADPGQPDAREIVQAIAAACHRPVEVVGLAEQASAEFGWSPWASWPPYFLDTAAATALGYRPVGSYRQTVLPVVEELCGFSVDRQARLTADSDFPDRFDYAVDDAALETVQGVP
jgi:nucleoside-diphosphate-sugar epimerase